MIIKDDIFLTINSESQLVWHYKNGADIKLTENERNLVKHLLNLEDDNEKVNLAGMVLAPSSKRFVSEVPSEGLPE